MNTPYIPYFPEEACTCKVCNCEVCTCREKKPDAAEAVYLSYRERLNTKTPNFGSSEEFAEKGDPL